MLHGQRDAPIHPVIGTEDAHAQVLEVSIVKKGILQPAPHPLFAALVEVIHLRGVLVYRKALVLA